MEQLTRVNQEIENDYVKAFKANGGRVVGITCVFTPVEILEAAGVLPFRIKALGNSKTEHADARLSRFNCSFCRSCLELGLDGVYDFLDGLIETNGCDQLRGMFENWQYAKQLPFFHYLKVPHIITDDSLDYFMLELRRYREAVETYFEHPISDQALWQAIERQQMIRDKLHDVYRLRELVRPAITGAQVLELVLASSSIPITIFETLIDSFLKQARLQAGAGRAERGLGSPDRGEQNQARSQGGGARILLGGAATDEVDFVKMVEGLGSIVVADTFCFGSRAFWPRVETGKRERTGDPIRTLAELYIANVTCPRMNDSFPARLDYILTAAGRAKVDGAILVHNKFCDLHGIENALLRIRLEEQQLPVMTLEKEYGGMADLGRMKTRVQAFLERLSGGKT